MAYEVKDFSGSMFRNEKNKETQPDYKGNVKIAGVEYWISGWVKTPENKKPYMSLSFQVKQKKEGEPLLF